MNDVVVIAERLRLKIGKPPTLVGLGHDPEDPNLRAAPAVLVTEHDEDTALGLARWNEEDEAHWVRAGWHVAWRGDLGGDSGDLRLRFVLTRGPEAPAARLVASGPLSLLLDPALGDELDTSDPRSLRATLGKRRIAIVTYELVGLTKTGGIGTATTATAHTLASHGAHVDILFTGQSTEGTDLDGQIAEYAKVGINLCLLGDEPIVHSPHAAARRAVQAYYCLRDLHNKHPYDIIHVPECSGHAWAIVSTARGGVAFGGAEIVATVHAPSRWIAEQDGRDNADPELLALDHLERLTVAYADSLVSPSRYLLRQLEERSWALPRRIFVEHHDVPPSAERETQNMQVVGPVRELVYFGRQEKCKGFDLFLDALDLLVTRVGGSDVDITFLGRPWIAAGRSSLDTLADRRRRWPWAVRQFLHLGQPEALHYLTSTGRRLPLMPSVADNLPMTVTEALSLQLPFIATAAGGIPELIDARDAGHLVEPVPTALANAVVDALEKTPSPLRFAVSPASVTTARLQWHARLRRRRAPNRPMSNDCGASTLVVSTRHVLREGALERLEHARQQSGADVVTFAVERPDGSVIVPLGGPPVLGSLYDAFSVGSALIAREALGEREITRGSEAGLYGLLTELALEGRQFLVIAEPMADEIRPAANTAVLEAHDLDKAPRHADFASRAAALRSYARAQPQPLRELPAVASGLREQLGEVWRALRRSDALVLARDEQLKELRCVLEERVAALERELGETRTELAVVQRRYSGLRMRRSVRMALRVADLATRLRSEVRRRFSRY